MIYITFRITIDLKLSEREPDSLRAVRYAQIADAAATVAAALDGLNAAGQPVRAAWRLCNVSEIVSLPAEFAAGIALVKKRIDSGDEIEVPGYNDAFLSVMRARELEYVIEKALRNRGKTGVLDIFGGCTPVLTAQSGFYTAGMGAVLQKKGIAAISAALPPSALKRINGAEADGVFNPRYSSRDGIAVIPSVSADAKTLFGGRGLLARLTRAAPDNPAVTDMLLLAETEPIKIGGTDGAGGSNNASALPAGLIPLITAGAAAAKAYGARFTAPYAYFVMRGAVPPRDDIIFTEASGAYSESFESTELWTMLQQVRSTERAARSLAARLSAPPDISADLSHSMRNRIRALESGYFGPRPSAYRAGKGRLPAGQALDAAKIALNKVVANMKTERGSVSVLPVTLVSRPVKGLLRLPAEASAKFSGLRHHDERLPSFVTAFNGVKRQSVIVRNFLPPVKLTPAESPPGMEGVVSPETAVQNLYLGVHAEKNRIIIHNKAKNRTDCSLDFAVKYCGVERSGVFTSVRAVNFSCAAQLLIDGVCKSRTGAVLARFSYSFTLPENLPYVYADAHITYANASNPRAGSPRVFKEVAPFRISLPESEGGYALLSRNFYGELIRTAAAPARGSKKTVMSCPPTNGFIAAGGDAGGLLLAQSPEGQTSFAFCPLLLTKKAGGAALTLNPFGSYGGKRKGNPADKGFKGAAHTYSGKASGFSLMLAPFSGTTPDDALLTDAAFFYNPPFVLK